MRLDNERPSDNIEDRRGAGGGLGFPQGGGGMRLPVGGRGGMSLSTIIILVVLYFVAKAVFGIDLLDLLNGGGGNVGTLPGQTQQQGQIEAPSQGQSQQSADVTGGAGKEFVARVLGSTERVWGDYFQGMGHAYEDPHLVLFSDSVQSACGMAQSVMGPFYCPADHKVYIDLSFYQDMRDKLGAPGDFAQAYVVAHEVGHHVQNLFGIADKVNQARTQSSEVEANALSVKMELQADCLAGVWAKRANDSRHILEEGDVEEALNAASQIGDDRLQRRSQGYVVPDTFTHGSSEQRVRWFKNGMASGDIKSCDSFGAKQL